VTRYAHLRARASGLILAAQALVLCACSKPATTGAHTAAPASKGKRPPAASAGGGSKVVKSEGLRDFDAGLRALKLGGPEANREAASRFQRAVELDAGLWEAWFDLGVVRVRLGDDKNAIPAFTKALERNPGHRPSRLARAEASRRLRRYSDAREDYEAILRADAADNATRLRQASLLRESGDTDGSLRTVREVLRRSPAAKDIAAANVELGLVYLAAGREELAELVLSKAAEADARNPAVWNALGLVSLRRGKDQEAFERLDRATNVDPQFRDARFNKAAVLLDAGDYAQAKGELEMVVRGMPEDNPDLDALVALGVAERGLGNYPQARATWEKVLRASPTHADALWNLAILQLDFLHQDEAARDYLTRYLDAAPDDHPRKKDAQARLAELAPEKDKKPGAGPAPGPGSKPPAPGSKQKKGAP
jgi:tetratricopeptide (TPR) repeat protein